MDTEALRLFVLAAEKLNISAAGRDLGMAPAVSSARLAKLEKNRRCGLAASVHPKSCVVTGRC
ncbi:LysR family transcriptional regulator [uncultured Roseobacter sp.]|uniref:LysR family transcriptional regulator n=1 Tax=uncultured Roseobacter sp. TaxID=114847 RepID=UPI0034535FD6